MDAENRHLTADDIEQAVHLESAAFYNQPTPDRLELMRAVLRPEWTMGAFIDGRLVADVRTIPVPRRINGAALLHGAVGPVACRAEYRRRGYVGRLLGLALDDMRRNGIATAGLYTPHDALYRRYGWERAEGKRRYSFEARDIHLRLHGHRGTFEHVGADDWARLDGVYRRHADPRNGPLHRVEPWWRFNIFQDFEQRPREAVLWHDPGGEAQGFIVYGVHNAAEPMRHDLVVRDMIALTPDAYLGLWQYLGTHDIAVRIHTDAPLDDPFPDLLQDPWRVQVERGEGAMLRIVDVERALSQRPYVGHRPVSFTMRIEDSVAPWNDGVWRVEAAEGRMEARLSDGEADIELSVNFLAPLFTGLVRAGTAAATGMVRVHNPDALPDVAEAFAVTYPPYCPDSY